MHKIPIITQVNSKLFHMLSCLDRDPLSKTYGCFDRLYWGWKLKDYADITMQRMVYPTAKILLNNSMLDEKHLEWILSSIRYINKKLHNDGSIDQAFFGEHSHAATGFLLFDITNLYLLIQDLLNEEEKKLFFSIFKKMGEYLLKYDENHGLISNHLLGVAASLINLYLIIKKEIYKHKATEYIDRVIDNQNKEGCFIEYGGADAGYQTLAIYYLSYIYKNYPSEKIKESLYRAIEFISYFVHPDGSYGGEYGSRNTEILYIGGLVLLSDENELAKSIVDFMLNSYENHKTVTLDAIDDGNLAPLINNFLLISHFNNKDSIIELPHKNSFIKEFKDIGVVVYSSEKYYAIVNIKKGGIVKVFDKSTFTKVIDHCGFYYKYNEHYYTSSACLDNNYELKDNVLIFKVLFSPIKQPIPSVLSFLILKLSYLIFNKSYTVRELFKKILAKLLIERKADNKQNVEVKINFNNDDVRIEILDDSQHYKKNMKFSTIHMASSKYYQLGE